MKMISRRSFLAVCGVAAAAGVLTACGSSSSASSTAASTASSAASTASSAAGSDLSSLSGTVSTGGSTSMNSVVEALTEGFAEIAPNVTAPNVTISYDPTGSGAGITGAVEQTLDIGLASRALHDDETGVTATTVALDGIAMVVNTANTVADLTVDQLAQIFTKQITNWADVGGEDGEIVVIGREAGSGTLQPSGHRLRFPVRCGRHRQDPDRGRCGVQRGDRSGWLLRGPASLQLHHQRFRRAV